jgi:hypothetical protein
MSRVDLLGQPLTRSEEQVMHAYEALKALAADPDLPPCTARNVKKALACMWQVANDHHLLFEQVYDLGV